LLSQQTLKLIKMKYLKISCLFAVLNILASCASTKIQSDNIDQSNGIDNGYTFDNPKNSLHTGNTVKPNQDHPSNELLSDMIAKLAGVEVAGRGYNMHFKVRGANSFYSGSDPLFVLNGRPVGTDFSQIVTVIDPNMVTSIRVLKGPDATIYGSRGANGVITIRTKE
jgi:TonB-dependent SusC/RagA subfamily outer membrane receptor